MGKILKLNEKLEFEVIETKCNKVSYKELRDAVGNIIEHVTYNEALQKCNIDVWLDEEGKLKALTPTALVGTVVQIGPIPMMIEMIDICAGPLVFTSNKNDGESYGLSDAQIEIIKEVMFAEVILEDEKGKSYRARVLPYR